LIQLRRSGIPPARLATTTQPGEPGKGSGSAPGWRRGHSARRLNPTPAISAMATCRHGRHLPGQRHRDDAGVQVPTSGTPTISRMMAACEEIDAFQRAQPMLKAGAPE